MFVESPINWRITVQVTSVLHCDDWLETLYDKREAGRDQATLRTYRAEGNKSGTYLTNSRRPQSTAEKFIRYCGDKFGLLNVLTIIRTRTKL